MFVCSKWHDVCDVNFGFVFFSGLLAKAWETGDVLSEVACGCASEGAAVF